MVLFASQRPTTRADMVKSLSQTPEPTIYIVDDEDHLQYIARLGRAFEATDWRLLAYALMGTHTHWFSQAGMQPFEAVAKPVHSGFARWFNRKHGRLGPILAERPSTYIVKPNSAARVAAGIWSSFSRQRHRIGLWPRNGLASSPPCPL